MDYVNFAPWLQTLLTVLGLVVLFVGAVVVARTTAKNKGYEALKEALDSWKLNAEAKSEELKIEKQKNEELRRIIETANIEIAQLKSRVASLESRPDLGAIIQTLTGVSTAQEERIKSVVEVLGGKIDEKSRMAREYHSKEIEVLTSILKRLEALDKKDRKTDGTNS